GWRTKCRLRRGGTEQAQPENTERSNAAALPPLGRVHQVARNRRIHGFGRHGLRGRRRDVGLLTFALGSRAPVGKQRRARATMRPNRIVVLLIVLGTAVALAPAPAHGKDAGQVIAVNPQTLKFTKIPDMPGCASAAMLRGDPRSGPAWVLLKLASGCRVPWHWHTANEELLVISGSGSLAMKDGRPVQF